MAKIPLTGGYYQARDPIANAQVAFNVYPEQNPQDAPFPVTDYPAPGLAVMSDYSGTYSGYCRGLYQTSSGAIIAVFGTTVISWRGPDPAVPDVLGSLVSDTGGPVSICDNGTTVVLVDGGPNGYTVPLANLVPGSMQQIVDPGFLGSPRVDYIDTFFVFTQTNTQNFYTTTSNVVTPFDPTYFAAKAGWNDRLVTAVCLHDNIWLLGNETTEIWFNAGGATFPFARMPNSILQQGCCATYSAVVADNAVYWISQDRWGRNMCMRGEGYSAKRISTFAVEDAWSQLELSDAIGMVYQIGGHETVGFYFPSSNAWWAYDASSKLWHQRTYNGLTNAWLPSCAAGWGSVGFSTVVNNVLVGDRTAPRILQLSRDHYTDVGAPITRQRSWLHVQQDGQRIHHSRFAASMAGTSLSPDTVTLDWSDDAGQSFGTPVNQTIGNATNGQYQWRRLGSARDRVYRLTWSGAGECALQGAYIDVIPQGT